MKDFVYAIVTWFLPLLICAKDFNLHKIIITAILGCLCFIFGMIPYMISNKCILEVLIGRHPLTRIKLAYKNKYKTIYFLTSLIIFTILFEYLVVFNIIKI